MDPPLYPTDPVERRRALALEDWFDENLGPAVRRYVFHALAATGTSPAPWVNEMYAQHRAAGASAQGEAARLSPR